jgi:hypothetical protein
MSIDVPYVKAEVDEETQRALNVAAAEYDLTVSEVAGMELEKWYDQSGYDVRVLERHGENDE